MCYKMLGRVSSDSFEKSKLSDQKERGFANSIILLTLFITYSNAEIDFRQFAS